MSENEILSELLFNPDEGSLRFKEVRYLLIRPETLAAFQIPLEEQLGSEKAGELLYKGGYAGGRLSGRKYKEEFGLSDREAVEFMCRMGGQIGWGRFQLLALDAGAKTLVVKVAASPFAEAYQGSTAGAVCHLIRGVLGGLASGIFDVEVQAEETQCQSKGDAHCRFEIRGLQ